MYRSRHSSQTLTKIEFSRQIFEKYSNIKFNGIPSSGSRVASYGRTHRQTERQKDMIDLIVAFHTLRRCVKAVTLRNNDNKRKKLL